MKKKRWIPLLFSGAVALLLLSFIFFTFFQINFRPFLLMTRLWGT